MPQTTPIGCTPYPSDWPTECFSGLRQLYAEGRLFTDLAKTHHHCWTIQGFLAGKLLSDGEPEPSPVPPDAPLRPIGDCPCPDDCKVAMQALLSESEGIKAMCNASQGLLGDVLKSALAEAVRQGLPQLLNMLQKLLDRI